MKSSQALKIYKREPEIQYAKKGLEHHSSVQKSFPRLVLRVCNSHPPMNVLYSLEGVGVDLSDRVDRGIPHVGCLASQQWHGQLVQGGGTGVRAW